MAHIIRYNVLFLLAAILLFGCTNNVAEKSILEKDADFDQLLVINEVLATNHTGLLSADGDLHGWVEIKNVSGEVISLKGCSLASDKKKEVADSTAMESADSLSLAMKTWDFPDVSIQPGEVIVVFESKKKDADKTKSGDEFMANIKLPSKNGIVRIISDHHTILSEMQYDHLKADQVCRRLKNGETEYSYIQTPGQENTPEGYEAYCESCEKQRTSPVRIWELVSRSAASGYDWVEVKNVSAEPVNLQQYCLATDPDKPEKWHFPDMQLNPGQLLCVKLAGKKAAPGRQLLASMKLGSDETILLTKDGKFQDGACGATTRFGFSVGRTDGRKGFFYFNSPTYNAENTEVPHRYMATKPTFVQLPGNYENVQNVEVTIDTHGQNVHYTLDGSEPTMGSPVYTKPLNITRTTIVKAFAEGDNALRSATTTAGYFLNAHHTLAIVHITINPADLYDPVRGLMVPGPGGNNPDNKHGANCWAKNSERRAHVSFFDGKEGFETDCGFKITGGNSRLLDKRAFLLKFREQYGEPFIDYDVFERGTHVKYKSLKLRGGSQDWNGVMVRDEFFTSLMGNNSKSVIVQDYRPVALYLNNDYYGLYYIREKIDDDFIARKLGGVDKDSTNYQTCRFLTWGSNASFNAARSYVGSHDMTLKESHDHIDSIIDAEGFFDHFLAEYYSSNTDLCNVRFVQSDDPKSDGKWHVILFDVDESWKDFRLSNFYFTGNPTLFVQDVLLVGMLKNAEFRKLFLERLSYHMHHTFNEAYASGEYYKMIEQIRPEMKLNCQRWPSMNYERWERNVADFAKNFKTRPKIIFDDLRRYLSVTPEEERQYFGDLGL